MGTKEGAALKKTSTPNQQHPKRKKWVIALLVLAVVFALASLPDRNANTAAYKVATDSYGNHLVDFVDSQSANGSVKIVYNIVYGWSNESTRFAFWHNAHETIKNLWTLKQQGKTDFGSIQITAMAEYKDAYGNISKDRAIDIAVNTDFLSRVNWSAFTSDELAQLAGIEFSYFCHPEFK